MECKTKGCTEVNPEFHVDRSRPSGLHPYCKACKKAKHLVDKAFKRVKKYCMDCTIDITDMNAHRKRCEGCAYIYYKNRPRQQHDRSRAQAMGRMWRKANPDKVAIYRQRQKDKRAGLETIRGRTYKKLS